MTLHFSNGKCHLFFYFNLIFTPQIEFLIQKMNRSTSKLSSLKTKKQEGTSLDRKKSRSVADISAASTPSPNIHSSQEALVFASSKVPALLPLPIAIKFLRSESSSSGG
jgi:hypothetical protein